MKNIRILAVVMMVGLFLVGCSQQDDPVAPQTQTMTNKDGTEILGEITIADGTGFVEGGVGMVGNATGMLDITVPAAATVEQVLLYWVGGTTSDDGDDQIMVDGNPVDGALIGGGTNFFGNYDFYGYRADVTAEGWVVPGANSFEISGFDFDFSDGTLDENNGAGMIVIYDDGSTADLQLFDGLDMAFFKFSPTLDATMPVTFDFLAEGADRTAQFVVLAGSVGAERPNHITAITSAGVQQFDNPLGSMDGPLFDSITLDVLIPAGDTSLTVQLFSTVSETPLGASMGWLASGLSVPTTELASLGDFVWEDLNMDGIQDVDEPGVEDVLVRLMDCGGQIIATTTTAADGSYWFTDLLPGDYNVQFVLPNGYVFSPQDVGGDDTVDSDADPQTGMAACTTLDPGEVDPTWDAGIYMPVEEGCTLTIGFWKKHAGLSPQDDVLSQYLPIWLGDDGGSKSYHVTTNVMAVDFLVQKEYGHPDNGITKLYAQMLAAKLNVAAGADYGDISDYLDDADAFLADYNYMDWESLSDSMVDDVHMWHTAFDHYNNGDIGPGHCDDDDDDDDDDYVKTLRARLK